MVPPVSVLAGRKRLRWRFPALLHVGLSSAAGRQRPNRLQTAVTQVGVRSG